MCRKRFAIMGVFTMKRSKIILFAVLLYSLCGCSALPSDVVSSDTGMPPDAVPGNVEILPNMDSANIETLKGWLKKSICLSLK